MSDQTSPSNGDWSYNNSVPGSGGVNYAFVATGTIQVNTAGTYTFDSGSDDGSRLVIDGQVVVDESNPEPFAENFGSISLSAGTHSIQWTGYQQYGGAGFELSVADGGGMTGPVTTANGWHVLGDPNPDPAISLPDSLSVTVSYSQPQGGQDNVVAGNYIGTNAAGNAALGNGHDGILVENGAQNNTIGGTGTWDRNVISGNKGTINAGSINNPSEADGGVSINNASNNRVEGNLIGTNVAGNGALGNSGFGVAVIGTATGNTIGGAAAARNVISANSRSGIGLELGATDNSVLGNYVGTDITGNTAIGNAANGILIQLHGDANTIQDNVVSGNGLGINIIDANNNVVKGNLVGTNAAGTAALGNTSFFSGFSPGVDIFAKTSTATGNLIGGTTAADRNVISANKAGVWIQGAAATGNTVQGNYIGTDVTGTVPLGNTGPGVELVTVFAGATGANNNTIGGRAAGAGNLITGNGGAGVLLTNFNSISNTTGSGVVNNQLTGNSIYNNGGQGIDLGGDGVTLNDSQGHIGPDNFQDFPVLNSAVSSSSDTAITGTFSEAAEANTTITLDFYANSTAAPSGHGQGQTYLGSAQVTTDANGNTAISVDLGTGNLAGQYITATATDPGGNTSEFAQDIQAMAASSGLSYNSAYLQSLLPQSSTTSNQLSIQTKSNLSQDTVLAAVNALTAPSQPVTIILDLGGGTYNDTTVNPPANVTLIINGANGTNTYVGNSPAFTVTGGNVIVESVTFTTATDAPTILVTGGSLTLRNDTVQESTGFTDAAISITGGTVDLGSAGDPGGNTLNVNGTGELVHNTTANLVTTDSSDKFEVNGTALTAANLSFTRLTCPVATSTYGQNITLTATVRPNTSSGTAPTGTVTFYDGDPANRVVLGTGTLSTNGSTTTATFSTNSLAIGTHTVYAVYGGDSNYTLSIDSIGLTITAVPTLTLSGPNQIDEGGTYELNLGPVVDANPNHSVLQFTVHWGDGTSDTYDSNTQTADHTYSAAGTHTVSVDITEASGSWATPAAATMPWPAVVHTAAALDSKIYVYSGWQGNGTPQNQFAVFDPASSTWTALPTPSPDMARYDAPMAAAGGNLYLFGGTDPSSGNVTDTIQEYVVSQQQWITLPATLPDLVGGRRAVTAANGDIYIMGGLIPNGPMVNEGEVFDPTTGTVQNLPAMPVTTGAAMVVATPDGSIYVIGGGEFATYLDAVQRFTPDANDPANGTWELLSNQPLPNPRYAASAVLGADGHIYILGGNDGSAMSDVEAYTPGGGWSAVAQLPVGVVNSAAAVGSDGRIYVFGGASASTDGINTVQILTPPVTSVPDGPFLDVASTTVTVNNVAPTVTIASQSGVTFARYANAFGNGADYTFAAQATDAQGRTYVPGLTQNGQVTVTRYNADGSIDTSFGTGGTATSAPDPTFPDVDFQDSSPAVALDSQGRILVTASYYDDNNDNDVSVLARFTPNGTPDSSFGDLTAAPTAVGAGTVVTLAGTFSDPGGSSDVSYSYSWTVSDDQGDAIPGASGSVSNYTGSVPDFSFTTAAGRTYTVTLSVADKYGAVGTSSTTLSVAAPAVSIVNAEHASIIVVPTPDLVGASWFPNITVDPTTGEPVVFVQGGLLEFAGDGTYRSVTTSAMTSASAGAVDSQGRFLEAGTDGSGNFGVMRFQRDGTLDTSFGQGGIATVQLPAGCNSMALDSAGNILLAGSIFSANGYVARLTPNGVLDPTFGNGGIVLQYGGIGGVAEDPTTHKILVSVQSISNEDILLARLNPDGTLDNSFGSGAGLVDTGLEIGSGISIDGAIAIDATGRILIPVGDGHNLTVNCFNSDGTPQNSFSTAYANPSLSLNGFAAAAVGSDGKIFLTSIVSDVNNNFYPALVTGYTSQGQPDGFGDLVLPLPSRASAGSLIDLAGRFTYTPGVSGSPFTYNWSVTDNNGDVVPGATGQLTDNSANSVPDFTFTPVHGGTYTVTLTVTDQYGVVSAPATDVITVVAPTAHLTSPTVSQSAGSAAVGLTLTASDPTAALQAGQFTYTINWGDGTAIQTVTGSSTGAPASHNYTSAGIYTISVTATDQDGGTSQADTALFVFSKQVGDSITFSGGSSPGQMAVTTTDEGSFSTTSAPDQVLAADSGSLDTYTVNFSSNLTAPLTLAGNGATSGTSVDTLVVNGDNSFTNVINKTAGQITWGNPVTETVYRSGIANTTINANGTQTNYINDPGGSTTINGGPGANFITITATTGSGVVINGGATSNTYIVDLGNLAGPVSIQNSNAGATDNLIVNGATGNNTIAVAGNQIAEGTQTITDTAALANLTVNGGSGNNQLTVSSLTVPVQSVTLAGGGGTNTYNVNAGTVNIVAGTGVNVLNVTDGTVASISAPTGDTQPLVFTHSYTVLDNGKLSVPANGVLANSVSANGQALTAVLASGPAHGTVSLNADGSFTYMPAANFVGSDSFTYQAKGSDGTLSTAVPVTIQVLYHFGGFLAPLNSNLPLGLNRTIPIKFQLTDANGNYVTSLSAVTSLQVLNSAGADVLAGAGKTSLRYDATANQFVYNWQTKGLPPGSYTLRVTLADGSTHIQTIQLTASGSGANAQAADGSDVSGDTAGQLVAGDVELYVDNSNGDLTPDELARIQDAVNAIDATIAPYGVAINQVTDPAQADVTLSMNTNSAVGGFGQGILGCYTTTGAITLIQGWNWYAGADPTLIGANQYDFQTTVTHELGHALGLGESTITTSAMSGTLAPGMAIRTLTTADLNIPYDDGSSDAQRAVGMPASRPVSVPNNGQGIPALSNPSIPSSSPLSPADQLLADLAVLLSDIRIAYQTEVSSMSALWQSVDALALQRFDSLLSMEAGAMGLSKDARTRDLAQ